MNLLTFSNRVRSAADLQRTVALAPRKNVMARMRFTKKARKKYRPTTLEKKRGTFFLVLMRKLITDDIVVIQSVFLKTVFRSRHLSMVHACDTNANEESTRLNKPFANANVIKETSARTRFKSVSLMLLYLQVLVFGHVFIRK